MFNCLRYCQRFFNPSTLEAIDRVILHRRIYSNGKIIPNDNLKSISCTLRENLFNTEDKISSFDELASFINNSRRIQVEKISQLFTTIKDDKLTEKNVLLIFECCGTTVPWGNVETRKVLCQSALKRFESTGTFNEKVYESYISICTQNKQCLDVDSSISSIGSNLTHNLLKLILWNTCECGDKNKAMKILSEMKKKGCSIDEEVFNYLILVHTIEEGPSSGLKVIQTMNTAKIKTSSDSHFFLIKGLAHRKNMKEFKDALEQYQINYSEDKILCLLDILGSVGNHEWVDSISNLVDKTLLSRNFSIELKKLSTLLVHNGKYDAAFKIYKVFADPKLEDAYAQHILEEMLLCSAPTEKIVEFVNNLKHFGLNEYALENVTESALKNKLFTVAMNLFCHFDMLKPHYFWPILVEAHHRDGEIGLMDVIHAVTNMNVKFDEISFSTFIFPRCNLTNPRRLMEMFQEMGYTARTLLTPMIIALLKNKQVNEAAQLVDTYKDVKIKHEDIVKILPFTWLSVGDSKGCVALLQKIAETGSDLNLGYFLISVVDKLRNKSRQHHLIGLIKEFKTSNLRISSSNVDSILALLNSSKLYSHIKIKEIEEALNDILDFTIIPREHPFLHPNQMDLEQLELHLIELKSKGMETRGVLRKLINKYSGRGNHQRVTELRQELEAKGYTSSPGMKSAVLQTHVREGNLEEAMQIYDELTQSAPNFRMDSFKIVDLATLLVKNDRFDKAMEILKTSAIDQKNSTEDMKSWERNCLNLLKSIKDIDKQKEAFKILMDCSYCGPTNIILGAMIQLHLEKDTIETVVDLYEEYCIKYNNTPMQLVMIGELLESGREELLKRVLDASARVHGNTATRSALIAAMCEKGLVKQVVTVLQDPTLNTSKDLEKRCERWVHIKNMAALQTLLAAAKQLPPKLLNIPKIQLSIMQLYSKFNDCDGALVFWKSLVDEEDHVDTEVDNEFCQLLSRCKFSSPENLTMKYKLK
ncbi:leucine-rich PPR motif-containing protein, mitochondrial-like [Harmonia axyridis]|uniref:leucine-rich PPR motif-containing protein, mitochondrial-like n=1 Tax=Harmonia axyridis TaxID=115357 RepID=UPI001E275799|nr:leucine-rich PPR motif-containing protein, mitochondrial-like [Harmonia axyridis]